MFGIACAGKNYLGELLAVKHGFKFYNADMWITPQQLAEYQNSGEFSQATRDVIHAHIAKQIAALDRRQNIVIAQASIKAFNRQQILALNPDIMMVWVHADLPTLLERAASRNDYISSDYILKMLQNFDTPQDVIMINNSRNAEPLTQQLLTSIFDTNIS